MALKKIKPIANRISQWNLMNEVLYKCPKCDASFQIYGSNQNYCHMCGQAIDWGVIIKVNNRWKDEYHGCNDYQKQQELMREIDELNSKHNFNSPMEMTDIKRC